MTPPGATLPEVNVRPSGPGRPGTALCKPSRSASGPWLTTSTPMLAMLASAADCRACCSTSGAILLVTASEPVVTTGGPRRASPPAACPTCEALVGLPPTARGIESVRNQASANHGRVLSVRGAWLGVGRVYG